MEALHLIGGGDGGGAMTHVLSLLGELKQNGEAALAALGDGPLPAGALRAGIPCRVLRGGFADTLRSAEALCREASPAVLHCHGSRANLTGALLKARLSCRVISTVHSDPRLDYRGRAAAALVYGGANAFALRKMDALVCVSKAMTDAMRSRGFPPERLYTVYNGIDPARPVPRTDRARWRAENRIPADALLIGTAARLDRVKDIPTLLRGFALASRKNGRLMLAVAGAGRQERALRRLAAALGIADRLRPLGWVEDMESFFAALDIFALSSLSETFPFALLGAGRTGLPAVASAVGGVPELIGHEKSGLLFPPGDSLALARALAELAENGAERAALGAALQERTQAFTPQKTAERMREIYALLQKKNIDTGEGL